VSGEVRAAGNVLIDSNAVIYGPVSLAEGTYVGPNCVIGFPDSQELNRLLRSHSSSNKARTSLGRGCIIRSGSAIYSNVKAGDSVMFGHNVLIRSGVTIGKGTKVGTNVVVDGESSIGSDVSIQTGVYICTYSTVEDGVFLGPYCVFTNDKYMMQKPFKLVGPIVKKGASIGANALLFPAVTIGEGAVVGAQALVTGDIPPRTVFAGIPARKISDVPADWRSELLGK